jgi:hypothetical protein
MLKKSNIIVYQANETYFEGVSSLMRLKLRLVARFG